MDKSCKFFLWQDHYTNWSSTGLCPWSYTLGMTIATLITGISYDNFVRLQSIQNSLASVLTRKLKYNHITPSLKSLHWHAVRYRCHFKVLIMVYKNLSLCSPSYFNQVIKPHVSSVNTRSSNPIKIILRVP
jgi:hypothetical protein